MEHCVAPTSCKPFIPRILINSITCLNYCDNLSLRERCQDNLIYTYTTFFNSVTISIHSVRHPDLSHPDKGQQGSPMGRLAFLFFSSIERFHITSQRPYWCSKTRKRRPCWCTKLELHYHANFSFSGVKLTWQLVT